MFYRDMRYVLVLPEKCVFKSLNIEQELSLWLYLLQHSGCARGLAYTFSVVTLFFVFWSRWVGTGSQMYYSQVCQRKTRMIASETLFIFFMVFVVGGIKVRTAVCRWHNFLCRQGFFFGFVLTSYLRWPVLTICPLLEWKFSHINFSVWLLCDSVACSSFLCLTTVW